MMDNMVENQLALIRGQEMKAQLEGQANIFIETGYNKALLIDFNYEVEPLSGTYPLPGIGPLSLLRESYLNHLAKLFFKELYWYVVLQGIDIPFMGSKMSMAGKKKLPTQQPA
jgi:sulfide:quinone oxidoreductase